MSPNNDKIVTFVAPIFDVPIFPFVRSTATDLTPLTIATITTITYTHGHKVLDMKRPMLPGLRGASPCKPSITLATCQWLHGVKCENKYRGYGNTLY